MPAACEHCTLLYFYRTNSMLLLVSVDVVQNAVYVRASRGQFAERMEHNLPVPFVNSTRS